MSNFAVSVATGFVAPNGQSWSMRGLNMDVKDALPAIQGCLLQDYPGITAIGLVCNPEVDTAQSLQPIINAYTSRGIVVQIEDHFDTQNGDNTRWYSSIAQAFKSNPYVFLETPNEPTAPNTARSQIDIIKTIRATGFADPIGIQPIGGWDQSNISTVVKTVGTSNLFVTPHIYYDGTDPNEPARYVQSEIQQAASNGLFSSIDEFGNALDGQTIDPYGNNVIQAVIAANEAGKAGALFWAADNWNHPDGADSAFLTPDGCQLTSTGVMLQPWLSEPMTSTDSTPTSTTVSYITPSSGSAFDDNLQFIYSTSAGETLAAAAPTPDEFVFTSFAAGPHTITGFNPTQDVIEFSKAQFAAIANVEAATTAMAGGAMINLGNGSELLLPGVDPTSLQASNFALA